MIKKNAFKKLIVTMAVTSLFIINNGKGQISSDEWNRQAFNDVVIMVTDALRDPEVSVALCKRPVSWKYPASIHESEDKRRKFMGMTIATMSCQIQVIDILRANDDIDSLFYLSSTTVLRDGKGSHLPSVSIAIDSEWILFLNSPFLMNNPFDVSLMENYEKMDLQEFLNPHNFFSLYELGAGGLCTYFPEDTKYPPMFIYSEGLVDDFRTIIELQENRSLLSESSDSYENYYNSMEEELGKRVFSQLFENPNQE